MRIKSHLLRLGSVAGVTYCAYTWACVGERDEKKPDALSLTGSASNLLDPINAHLQLSDQR